VIRTEVWAAFVGSVTDVAVRVTVPPAGTAAGAVYVVAVVLAVEVGLKDPHELAGLQLQVTPAVSFVVAATVVVPETGRVAAGAVEIETVIAGGGGAVMLT
jgi:hypothetical protein